MKTKKQIRLLLLSFIVLLALSGITAFPLRTEMDFLRTHAHQFPNFLHHWILKVHAAINATPDTVLYGTDWLAFAHLVIGLFFIPVYINPIKYAINLRMAQIACIGVFPLAFICGPIRDIPFFHQVIDCSFGFFGFLLLAFIYKRIQHLEKDEKQLV
jgi:hypothetical protein